MIKPIYGAASIGVVKVVNLEDLTKTFTRVTKEMGNACIVAGAISAGNGEDAETEGGNVSLRHELLCPCLAPQSGVPRSSALPALCSQEQLPLLAWASACIFAWPMQGRPPSVIEALLAGQLGR